MGLVYHEPEYFLEAREPDATPVQDAENSGWWETLGSTFALDNFGVAIAGIADEFATDTSYRLVGLDRYPDEDPNFDPFEGIWDTPLEAGAYKLIGVKSPTLARRIKDEIEEEQAARKIQNSAGFWTQVSTGLIAGTLDPINIVPGGSVVAGARVGQAALKTAKSAAAAGFGAEVLSEATLQSTQAGRTGMESVANIAGATVLSGAFGGIASNVASRKLLRQIDDRAAQIKHMEAQDAQASGGLDASVGAAEASFDDTKQAPSFGVGEALSFESPQARGLHSEFRTVREATIKLAPPTSRTNMQMDGRSLTPGGDVDTRAKVRADRAINGFNREAQNEYIKYVKGKSGSRKVGELTHASMTRSNDHLSYDDFLFEVQKATRRGDQHHIPEVDAASKSLRKHVYDPVFQDAIDVELFSKQYLDVLKQDGVKVKTAQSYVNRVWRSDTLIQKPELFIDRVSNWMMERQAAEIAELRKMADENKAMFEQLKNPKRLDDDTQIDVDNKLKERFEVLEKRYMVDGEITDGLDFEDMQGVADEVRMRIVGSPAGRLDYNEALVTPSPRQVAGKASPRYQRTFSIPDELIEEFLENDPRKTAAIYARSMATDIEFKRMFGDTNMDGQIKSVMDERNFKEAAIRRSDKSDKEKAKAYDDLQRATDKHIRDIQAMRDIVKGQYKLPEDPRGLAFRASKTARQLNTLRFMGGVTLSAITDLARPLTLGLKSGFRDSFAAMALDMRNMKLLENQLEDMGVVSELVMSNSARAYHGLEDMVDGQTGVERGIQRLSDSFGHVSLMSPWNQKVKTMVAHAAMNSIDKTLAKVAKGEALSKRETIILGKSNLDGDMGKRVSAMMAKHADRPNKVTFPNAHKWEDAAARDAFAAALRAEVDNTIITPTGIDRGLWTHEGWGKLASQFKSFGFAATRRMLVAGMQERDAAVLSSWISSIVLGSMVYVIKAQLAIMSGSRTKEVDYSLDNLITQGFDRSGVIGWLMDGHNMFERMTGHGMSGAAAALWDGEHEPMSRYASRQWGAYLGPTADLVKSGLDIGQDLARGEADGRTLHEARKLVPYQNWLPLQLMLNQIEASLSGAN